MYHHRRDTSLTDYSRINRKNQTKTERFLWSKLRNRQLGGYKFHRQYAVNNYILDFFCIEKKLAIELDGSQHINQIDYDEKRTKELKILGITVVRFWDNEVFQSTNGVLETILQQLTRTSP